MELAQEKHADLLLATDPDSDRCAIAVRAKDGEFKLITGAEYTVYIPCPESEPLLKVLTDGIPTRGLLRKLGQYAVNVYEKQFNSMVEEGAVEQIAENAGILQERSRYSRETGLFL